MRLRSNPELRNLLATKPDIFVYGKAETPSLHNLSIGSYICYLHKSKLNVSGNFCRGIVIFYLT